MSTSGVDSPAGLEIREHPLENECAPIDVFLPDAVEEVEKLQKRGLIQDERHHVYAQTFLVWTVALPGDCQQLRVREKIYQAGLEAAVIFNEQIGGLRCHDEVLPGCENKAARGLTSFCRLCAWADDFCL